MIRTLSGFLLPDYENKVFMTLTDKIADGARKQTILLEEYTYYGSEEVADIISNKEVHTEKWVSEAVRTLKKITGGCVICFINKELSGGVGSIQKHFLEDLYHIVSTGEYRDLTNYRQTLLLGTGGKQYPAVGGCTNVPFNKQIMNLLSSKPIYSDTIKLRGPQLLSFVLECIVPPVQGTGVLKE